jgi:hypothetical protein
VKRAILVDYKIGMVVVASLDLGGGQQFKAEFLLPISVRTGTDKSQINFTFAEELIDLAIGFTLR